MSYDLAKDIQAIKTQKNAVILAHYYEDGDIQDIADHVGDSYQLAKFGQTSNADLILLAGVVFMAESVKLLNPTKKVIVPDFEASCSLVKESPIDKYTAWKNAHPGAVMVTYINSSAEVKAISDVIVTSSNAERIVSAIPADRPILFGPDRHLGRWLSKKIGREFVLWPGACEVHVLFNGKRLHEMKLQHPDALVIAHPECDDSVLALSDVVGSTSKLLETVAKHPAKKFIVATETGIFHQMKKERPEAELIQAPVLDSGCNCNNCPYMKLNTLEKIKHALLYEQPEVTIRKELAPLARRSLDNMMALAEGRAIDWS